MAALFPYLSLLFGGFSLTTVVLFLDVIAGRAFKQNLLPRPSRDLLLYVVAAMGITLYPTALGLSPWDFYRLGYQPVFLLFLLLTGVLLLWRFAHHTVALMILIEVILFNLHLAESDNLWDYLIDPIIALYAVGWVVIQGIKKGHKNLVPAPSPNSERGSE